MSRTLLLLTLFTAAYATPRDTTARDVCNPCAPKGATGTKPPTIGSEDLESMYTLLLASVKGIHFRRRSEGIIARAEGFCCRETLDCVNVQNLNIPMCYDKFTTHYAFPDGSYGSLTTGDYTANDGSTVNLINGTFTKSGGEKGDIYSQNPSAKPNTATLSIPPQYTAAGVGSAIPATELGSFIVFTTTFSGMTITTPTIIPGSTVLSSVSGQTRAVSTVPAVTTTTPTTIAPVATVGTSTPAAAPASTSSRGAAGHLNAGPLETLGMLLLTIFSFLLYDF
ncbi:hypothetical protein P154DRAFT_516672 [Amniculicola lignicola CBS 123094]|uniref:Uncharacterized protein n=1 Tax=Amniculicola lignicola CBS 123094 TaxID=1392246 RepID=A0A6A5X4M0_9PLEO|nr:hypothetical protein P154DRAFT_516672 [Amniculicola lignicola CBS 123094]